MNQSTCNPSPACNPTHSTPHAIRSNVVPATPHTIIHNGVPCVAIPLSEFKGIFDDVQCIRNALNDYDHILSVIHIKRLSHEQTNSLISNMFLTCNLHSEIGEFVYDKLAGYLPPDHPNHKPQTA